MPTGTGLPLCRKYICRGGSCQEHRGIMFLMAISVGSVLPEWWLSNSGQVAQWEPEYSPLLLNDELYQVCVEPHQDLSNVNQHTIILKPDNLRFFNFFKLVIAFKLLDFDCIFLKNTPFQNPIIVNSIMIFLVLITSHLLTLLSLSLVCLFLHSLFIVNYFFHFFWNFRLMKQKSTCCTRRYHSN